MSIFTISLPSNSSMDLYPHNKVSQWKTKLSEFVELEDRWEVGLLEVSFPGKVYNVYASHYYLIVGGLSENWTIVLDNGTYNTIHSIVGEIQRSIVTLAAEKNFLIERFLVQIRYSNRLKRIRILFTKYALHDTWVYFSEHLASMLGFDTNT